EADRVQYTAGDIKRNARSTQSAAWARDAKQFIAKINESPRATSYADLGLATLCRTNLMSAAVSDFLGLGLTFGPGLSAPTGQHPGGEHHGPDDEPVATATGPAPAGSPAPAQPTTSTTPFGSDPAPVASASAREG